MKTVFRAPGVFWDVVDGETVVCDVITGQLYKLNHIAAFLWDVCCDNTPVESLTARLAHAFPEQDIGQLAADVSRFLNSMIAKNLLIEQE